jgi:hypothetical protein
LELLDSTGNFQGGFVIQQVRGPGSEIDRQFMLDEIETERYPLLLGAEERYEARTLGITGKGFVESDLEFLAGAHVAKT